MTEATGGSRWRELAKNPRAWLGVIIAALAIAFILQNRESAQVNLLVFQVASPLWITLTVVFVAGLAAGMLLRGRRS
ncbi:LapA family protein [Propioniciclava coleopterorum]|uniref:LapA family protein n=1 Tax=Propioniciclava coleopterorum TaxID=2714937 RepID=A0A6G7Y5W9_9ACTN|nr:LapA family protein [Propioniciclava coleopterorum]QIK72205.1 LapA family protein [Propioniciclava coleopterorum]